MVGNGRGGLQRGAAMAATGAAHVSKITMLMAASIYKNVPYDVLKDFTPITMAAYGTMALRDLMEVLGA